jgi:hypothetical protein
MATAKHHLPMPGAPLARLGAASAADRDHGRLMPWLVLAAALLALGTASNDARFGQPAPAVEMHGAAVEPAASSGVQPALFLDLGTRAALASALSGL